MNYTQVRIKPEYRDKLAVLAQHNKRSMTRELEYMIDEATPTSAFDTPNVQEAMNNMMLKDIPEAWKPKMENTNENN